MKRLLIISVKTCKKTVFEKKTPLRAQIQLSWCRHCERPWQVGPRDVSSTGRLFKLFYINATKSGKKCTVQHVINSF